MGRCRGPQSGARGGKSQEAKLRCSAISFEIALGRCERVSIWAFGPVLQGSGTQPQIQTAREKGRRFGLCLSISKSLLPPFSVPPDRCPRQRQHRPQKRGILAPTGKLWRQHSPNPRRYWVKSHFRRSASGKLGLYQKFRFFCWFQKSEKAR